MNILFVNYGNFTTNSLNHIGGFANELSAQGHAVVVAVPSGKETLTAVPNPVFIPALYDELLAQPAFFPDRGTADIIHAWTPRECVRKFVITYQRTARKSAKLIVHLEDNEEYLISGYARRSISELRSMGFAELDAIMGDSLPHPVRYRTFLRLADAATVIVERLREFVPPSIPCTLLLPGVAPEYLRTQPEPDLLRTLGLAPEEKAIVFTGSNTFANEPEMRELYVAVRLLNQRGIPTRLVRTGFNRPEFLEGLSADLKAHVLDLGFIAKARLPKLLAVADALVQPGRPGAFNDFRLPSKLPEYLASGRPVVLPATNVALAMTDGVEALFLRTGTPDDIAACCERIFRDPALASRLGHHGSAFARKHFDLAANTAGLVRFYESVASLPSRKCWEVVRSTSGSDLTVAARELADTLGAAGPGSRPSAELADLASDLASIVRIEDERETGAAADRDRVRVKLEEMVRHLELQRDLTTQHAQNLEERIKAQDHHIKLHKRLSERHIQNLEARISGVEKIARAQMEAASAEHSKLVSRMVEMDTELKAREQRLKGIIGSRAWKLSAPLRDLERLFRRWTQKRPRPVPAQTPSGVHLPPANGALVATAHGARPPARVYNYTFNFDHPRTWTTASNKLLILGWCYENSGAPIRGIRAHFAGAIYVGIYGSKRLDVLASTGMKQSEYCGIKIDVKTHLGEHLLVVEVEHDDGWNPYFQTLVRVGKAGDPTELSEYEKWCHQHEALEPSDVRAIQDHIASFVARPVVSVVMPVFDPPEGLLGKAIQSVLDQIYPHWELCIADDASTQPHVREALERYRAKDPRIKVTYRKANGHICEATNTAVEMATGEWIAFFDHDDVLSPLALYEVAAEVDAHPGAKLIYSDEDKIDIEDRRFDPYFKPDWNPDLNHGQNYTSHLSVYRTELVRSLGGFRKGYEGSQDWDLMLRAAERIPPSSIRHIPKLLYHWRAIPGSTAFQLTEKSYPAEAARRALEDHFKRQGLAVEILPVPGDHWRIRYPLPSPAPFVSLIIPTRNAVKLLRQAVQTVLKKTDYPGFEVIVVDNGSDDAETLAFLEQIQRADPRVRVITYAEPFNYSAINNRAVREARGEVIGLLNNDLEAIDAGWLTEMVSHAVRDGIGAVGAMLYYPLNTVQHAGVVLGLGGVAGHPFKEFPRGDQGQKNRLRLAQNYSAVTAACLIIRKDRFLEVGGLNEKDLAVAFNDVDLCCKLLKAGYRNLWTPHAEFYHHESATRGVEDTAEKKARFQAEIDYMMNTWADFLMADPAYNPNLTLVGEDFSPAYLSRARKSWLEHLP